jgi:hypothetical protein
LEGRTTVLGTATPSRAARAVLKNLSSAMRQNGLFTTRAPASAASLSTGW